MTYTTVEFVKALAQIKYNDLGFNSENDFNNFITQLIGYASNIIDVYCGRSFSEPVPPLVSYAAAKIVSNMLHLMLQQKITPNVSTLDVTVKTVEGDVFTGELKHLLDLYRVPSVERA